MATTLDDFVKEQYTFIQDSRAVLFNYCRTISPEDLLRENSSFGRGGSIRNLLVHIANTYQYWILLVALQQRFTRLEFDGFKNTDDIERLFGHVDETMERFIDSNEDWNRVIGYEANGMKKTSTAFRLFSHVVTHEFHHKGQILSISRGWGYVPVDTDILR